jgi:hypothetical protein
LVGEQNPFGQVRSAALALRGLLLNQAKFWGDILSFVRNGEELNATIKSDSKTNLRSYPAADIATLVVNEDGATLKGLLLLRQYDVSGFLVGKDDKQIAVRNSSGESQSQ